MKLSLFCITLWAVALPLWGGTAPLLKEEGKGEKEKLDSAEADSYVKVNQASWYSIWEDLEVNPKLAEAVIYPELIRYSYWQDEMEKTAVSSCYITLGTQGPDFSVGHFQMKASWVEKLEKRWMQSPLHRSLEIYFDLSNSAFARKARISRLMNESFWQPVYLALYLRLLYTDYPDLEVLPIDEQVRLCATAYNNGAALPGPAKGNIDHLYQWSSLSSFHTDLVATPLTQMYCYSELSLIHFNHVSNALVSNKRTI